MPFVPNVSRLVLAIPVTLNAMLTFPHIGDKTSSNCHCEPGSRFPIEKTKQNTFNRSRILCFLLCHDMSNPHDGMHRFHRELPIFPGHLPRVR